jgi:hypothetical protein
MNMNRKYKPAALHCVWNIDLSITIYAGGKKIFKTSWVDGKESAESFIKGWFGEHEHNVRWTYTNSKSDLMGIHHGRNV